MTLHTALPTNTLPFLFYFFMLTFFLFLYFKFLPTYQLDITSIDGSHKYPIEDSILSEEVNPGRALNSSFVSLFGNDLLIGQHLTRSASFFTFVDNSTWTFTALLQPSISDPSDRFGVVVSVAKDIAVIGAPGYQHNQGCVYVFKDTLRNKHSWTQTSVIVASDAATGDEFGFSIKNFDNILVIGAPNRKYSLTNQVGAAYLFSDAGSNIYSQDKTITFYMSSTSTRFGCALASYGDFLLVGGCFMDPKAGALIVYNNAVLTTLFVNVIEPQSVMSLAMSSITAGIGFPARETGTIFLFYIGNIIEMVNYKKVFDGDEYSPNDAEYGDYFGASLAFLSNVTLYVSAPYHQQTGAIYVFKYLSKYEWDYAAKIFPNSPTAILFGASMSSYPFHDIVATSIYEENKEGQVVAKIMYNLTNDPQEDDDDVTPATKQHSKQASFFNTTFGLISIIFGSILVILICLVSCAVFKFIRPKSSSVKHFSGMMKTMSTESSTCKMWIINPMSCIIDPGPPIGVGGFGVVRKGVYKDGPRMYPVAIKVMSDENMQKENLKQKLIDEAAMMVELRSPFIVQVYGMCGSMLVMELMPLGSLYNLIESSSNHPQLQRGRVRIQIMIDVAKGLEYLHEKSVIHGDMKSPNILLCEEGGSLKAKITDFGLSRIGFSNGMSMTATSGVVSLKWAAPELLQESPRLSQGVDIYAFGMVMWELLTLKKPYDGLSMGSIVRKVVCGERENIPINTPEVLCTLMNECWCEFPESRPRAGHIREELVNFQNSTTEKEYESRTGTQQSLGSSSNGNGYQSEDLESGFQSRKFYNSIQLSETASNKQTASNKGTSSI